MATEDSYHHGGLRRALLDAALAILAEGAPLSLRGVARRAGVSHAAPYHHFADRRALLAAAAGEGLISLRRELVASALGGGEDPAARLLAIGVAYVRFALENRPLFRLIFGPELANRDDLPELQAAYLDIREMLIGMASGVLGDGADRDEVRLWALRGWSTVHGLAELILDEQVLGVDSIEDAEELTRRVLLAGVRPGQR